MTWTLHTATASDPLDGLVAPIETAIKRAQIRAERVTAPIDLDVVVQVSPGRTIAHLGHVGYAPNGEMMQLTFDPANTNCAQNLGEALERTVVHELHHVLRWRGPGYGRTLGEALVSEGLAGQFAQQLYGGPPERWETALEPDELTQTVKDAAAAWDDSAYDHAAWFFGIAPAWRGYRLGFALVGQYLTAHPEQTPATLVHAEAAVFRDTLKTLLG